jgi:hypothetical protein
VKDFERWVPRMNDNVRSPVGPNQYQALLPSPNTTPPGEPYQPGSRHKGTGLLHNLAAEGLLPAFGALRAACGKVPADAFRTDYDDLTTVCDTDPRCSVRGTGGWVVRRVPRDSPFLAVGQVIELLIAADRLEIAYHCVNATGIMNDGLGNDESTYVVRSVALSGKLNRAGDESTRTEAYAGGLESTVSSGMVFAKRLAGARDHPPISPRFD